MDLTKKIEALPAFAEYADRTGKTAAEVAEQAERVVTEQSPAAAHPKTLALRVARYMVAHREPAERAYLFC